MVALQLGLDLLPLSEGGLFHNLVDFLVSLEVNGRVDVSHNVFSELHPVVPDLLRLQHLFLRLLESPLQVSFELNGFCVARENSLVHQEQTKVNHAVKRVGEPRQGPKPALVGLQGVLSSDHGDSCTGYGEVQH